VGRIRGLGVLALGGIGLVVVFAAGAGRAAEATAAVGLDGSEGVALAGGMLDSGAWRRLEIGVGGRAEPSALARTHRGDVAVGDTAGVSWRLAGSRTDLAPGDSGESGERMRAVLPGVRDLEFDRKGELWIGTKAGLYRWHRSGRPVRRSLRGADGKPEIHDLAVSGNVLLVATAVGAFWSSTGEIFQPLEFDGVGAAVVRVALRSADRSASGESQSVVPGAAAEAWLLGGNRLIRISGRVTPVGLRVLARTRLSLPRPTSDDDAIDLAFDAEGDRLALAYPDLIAVLRFDRASVTSPMQSDWQIFRPVLAPGARVRSLAWVGDGLALSTDHGVFVAASPAGPYRRSADPVGTRDCVEVEAGPRRASHDSVLALCSGGLFAFEHGSPRTSTTTNIPRTGLIREPGPESFLPPDPPVEEIRRRAFARAGLDARRSAELWAGLRRRAFWPEIGLRFGAEFDDDEETDRDQSFVSGDTRHLFDRTRDRGRSFDAAIALDWDLRGVAYPLASVDLSRELRQIVSLRDDVADEINQLYFERQRLRASMAKAEPLEPGEADRIRWRAREIDAGLDAWTGGWIARWRNDQKNQAASATRDESRSRVRRGLDESLPINPESPVPHSKE